MNRIVPIGTATKRRAPDQKGIHEQRPLPDDDFDGIWDSLILPPGLKDRLLAQAVLNFTARAKLQQVYVFLPLQIQGETA